MQNKLSDVWKKILASVLVLALTAGNLMLIGSSMVSYAEANLENQDEKTAHANVEFGAYFESEGNKVHSLVCDAEAEEKLYIHLNVKEAGYLKSGKIEIIDANYSITGEIEESGIIGNIEENVFKLKQINYGTEELLEVPIALEIGERFKTENISKNSKVILTGIYVTTEGEEVAIKKEVTLNISWESIAQIQVASELKTYQSYENTGSSGIIIEEEIEVTGIANLPIQKTNLEVTVPTYMGENPETVRISSRRTEMTNGKTYSNVELNWEYDEKTGLVNIEVVNEENGEVYSKKGGKDEYVITYEYVQTADERKTEEVEIQRNVSVEVTTYSHSESVTEETIEKTDTLTEYIGSLLNGEIEIDEPINKAKIYANYNSNNREHETEYEVKEIINIAKADIVENVVIEGEDEVFIGAEQEEKSLSVEDVDYTYYKSTKIAVENFNKILSEAGIIFIEDENGVLGTIDASMEAEDGYYVVTYSSKPENIKISTSKPITEGDLILDHEKAIKADLVYSKEEVKVFREIKLTKQIGQTIDEAKQTIEGRQILTETVSHLNLISNKESINQKEEAIELRLEFGNDKENSILYSEPTVEITLPKFIDIKNVEEINAEVLFDEELEVGEKTIITSETGEKVIQIQLEGTQTKFNAIPNANGTTLVINVALINNQSGEGQITAEVEGNTVEVGLISYADSVDDEEIPNETEEKEEVEPEEGTIINVELSSSMENLELKEGEEITYIIRVNSQTREERIVVKDFLPEEVTFKEANLKIYNSEKEQYEDIKNGAIYDEKNRVVTLNFINNLEDTYATIKVIINKLDDGVYQKEIINSAVATYKHNDNIVSNTVKINVVKPKLNITKTSENILNVNKVGDLIKLKVKAESIGSIKADANLTVSLPESLEPISMKYEKTDISIERTNKNHEVKFRTTSLNSGETYRCEVIAKIKEIDNSYSTQYISITPTAILNEQEMSWNIKVENPNYEKLGVQATPITLEEQVVPEETKTYTIMGNAWIDENKSGVKEEGEEKLEDVKVSVLNVNNNTIVRETTTDSSGNYAFEEIEKGNYQIIFNYNGENYKVAEYKKSGENEINSSAIEGEKGKAVTDIIKIEDKDIVHNNIGLVKVPEFDMSLRKEVSKIIIQNEEGTKEYKYSSDLAKADINGKYLNSTVVLIEYKFIIKNEGELVGRVKKIVDYIPKDMIFTTDVNRTWVQGSDGNLYNNELKDIDIQPGETKEVTLILKKKMTEENTGIINNTAEIVDAENSENIKDKDSFPNNRGQNEDDISSANVLLGVKTGAEVMYVTLAIVVLIILTTGVYLIKRKVLEI